MINESTIRWFWSALKGDGKLTEIRLLGKKGSKGKTYSGYFTDIEKLLQALRHRSAGQALRSQMTRQ